MAREFGLGFMELSIVPLQQLLDIYVTTKKEIRRRQRRKNPDFRENRELVRQFSKQFPDLAARDFSAYADCLESIPTSKIQPRNRFKKIKGEKNAI
jgi:hypothetical protein